MKLSEVLSQLTSPPVGTTSLLAAMFGDGSAAAGLMAMEQQKTIPTTREEADVALAGARKELQRQEQWQSEAKSDAAYWSYQGSVSYWKCVSDILEAAALVGPDSLPDLAIPSDGGVLMDLCAQLERFGKSMLELAKIQVVRTDPRVITLGVGPSVVDLARPPEPGTKRRLTMIKPSDIERLAQPMLELLNSMREGESPDALLGVLMIVCGQIAAQNGAIIKGDQPVEQQLAPLWWGYGQAVASEATDPLN